MQKYKINLNPTEEETSDHFVSTLISEEEADILADEHYAKFVVGAQGTALHCEIGPDTDVKDLLAATARIIGNTYLNLQEEDPSGQSAELFRETLENAMSDPLFWEADNKDE